MKGRTALVTGASYGLGTRFAKVLAGAGANLVLAARGMDKLAAVAAEVERLGVKALAIGCDVTVPAQVAATVEQAWDTFGRVDILVNNAGVVTEAGVMPERITDELFAQTIATNLNGLFSFCREVGARQLADGGALVIDGGLSATLGGVDYSDEMFAAMESVWGTWHPDPTFSLRLGRTPGKVGVSVRAAPCHVKRR